MNYKPIIKILTLQLSKKINEIKSFISGTDFQKQPV